MAPLLPCLLLLLAGDPGGSLARQVVLVSVDGLRADALLAARDESLPAFQELLSGAGTLDARCDPWLCTTLPNHVGIATGRLLRGPGQHGWDGNELPAPEATLHDRGGYLPGIFDVAHDRGLATGLFAAKEKFVLLDRSWNEEHGAADGVPPDDGRDKVDRFVFEPRSDRLVAALLAFLEEVDGRPCLAFLHLADPDLAGHRDGWDVSPDSSYMQAVARSDAALRHLLAWAREQPPGSVAVVLTADHGGGAPRRQHWDRRYWVNRIVPLLAWRNDGAFRGDLYALNPELRRLAGLAPAPGQTPPPVRNADAGNLALGILGLPPIPGSATATPQPWRLLPADS